ncbi:hypothetical protein [Arthrobacter bambusae]|uniref:hypothetical protein n=1 Tax=Arthrobacter bambusae TaxID=1338426 RepID=UPI002787F782|nr:hypothetical protein [Arthrobacter bambusae]MDQ0028781.1 hypothetical protein [Arthrobacter bambusae]MDQ0096425.1 hypothetical protein [Arthrobacter bambusae]
MVRNRSTPGWWRTGKVSRRLVCLGVALGMLGALAFFLSYAWGREINASGLVWGLYFLVLEALVTGTFGLVVAGVVISARFLVTEAATRKTRAVVTGVAALMSSSALAVAFCGLFPLAGNPWAVAGITGALVGSLFAIVSYRHTSQV